MKKSSELLNQNKNNSYNLLNDNKNKNININNEEIETCPKKLYFYQKELFHDSSIKDFSFILFKSVNNVHTFIFINNNNYIVSYNLINNQKINVIKNNNNDNKFIKLKYILDNKNKRDLVMAFSYSQIKVWNNINWECIFNYKDINKSIYMSSFFLIDNNNINIIFNSDDNNNNINVIKVYDLNGNEIKKINIYKNKLSDFITYYDNKLSKHFFIISDVMRITSYDYNENKIYNQYQDVSFGKYKLLIRNDKEITKLLGLSIFFGSVIKIWNFHSAELLNTIYCERYLIYSCFWNNKYLINLCRSNNEDKIYYLQLFNLKNEKCDEDLINFREPVLMFFEKINHPYYGECLIYKTKDNKYKLILQDNKNIN